MRILAIAGSLREGSYNVALARAAAERAPEGTEVVLYDRLGELTVKGVTKPVELRGAFLGSGIDPMGNERIAVELQGTIDRTEFGVSWNAPLPGGDLMLPNDVFLTASFAAVKAA